MLPHWLFISIWLLILDNLHCLNSYLYFTLMCLWVATLFFKNGGLFHNFLRLFNKIFCFSQLMSTCSFTVPPHPPKEKNSPSPPHSSTPPANFFFFFQVLVLLFAHAENFFPLVYAGFIFWDINSHTKIFHNSHWGPCGLSSSWSSYFNCCVFPLPGH